MTMGETIKIEELKSFSFVQQTKLVTRVRSHTRETVMLK